MFNSSDACQKKKRWGQIGSLIQDSEMNSKCNTYSSQLCTNITRVRKHLMLDPSTHNIPNKISFFIFLWSKFVFVKFPLHFVHNGWTPCGGIRGQKKLNLFLSYQHIKANLIYRTKWSWNYQVTTTMTVLIDPHKICLKTN